jgi:hypothetical protein
MRALASMGIVEEVASGHFALTRTGALLRRDAKDSVWASIVFWSDLLADAWTYLPECVRAGSNSGAATARARDGSPSRWSLEPDGAAIFHRVFAEGDAADFSRYAAAYDFSSRRVVADLGGGGGGLISAILASHPAARGMLVERPGAIEGGVAKLKAAGLESRCDAVAGDLMQSVPPGADVYMMRCVLHGYDDESAARILGNVRQVMTPESRLLVIEATLPDRVERADSTVEQLFMSDLNMLAVTGGRERSESEWRSLMQSAGLKVRNILSVPGETSSIVECELGEENGLGSTSAAAEK